MLASPYPIVLLWGPEYVQLYNDAFRPILGDKDSTALGTPAALTYSEVWPIITTAAMRANSSPQTMVGTDGPRRTGTGAPSSTGSNDRVGSVGSVE